MMRVKAYLNRYKDSIHLARQSFGTYRYQILILSALGFLGGVLEGVGINAVIPLLSFIIGTGPAADLDIISKAIRSVFEFLHIPFQFRYLLVFIVVLFVLKAIVMFIITYVTVGITARYEKEVRSRLFQKTLRAQWGYLLGQKLGHLETILMTNVRWSADTLERVAQMLTLISGLIVYSAIAVNISFSITAFTFLLGAVVFLALRPVLRAARKTSTHILNSTKEVARYVNENVIGVKTVKTTGSEHDVFAQGGSLFEVLRTSRIRSTILRSFSNVLIQPIGLIFISVIFAFSYKTDTFVFSAFLAVVYLVQRIFANFQTLQTNVHKINEAAPFLKNVIEYEAELDARAEVEEGGYPPAFEKELTFNDVWFSYPEHTAVLTGISFTLKKGEMVGLIGPSGSGKTTVVDLLLRLFSPQRGTITVDGTDISEFSISEWRKNVGYVSQDIFLMNDTIENNIRFHDDSLSTEDIREAARKAHILAFIESIPQGFQTVIGERGVLLSAGQRQRIVIARVLARKPKLLILDEATSALDNESEAQIQKVIEELRGSVTTLVVAHRLSTIINSSKLFVLKGGKIVEEGEPKALLRNTDSYFYKAYNIRK